MQHFHNLTSANVPKRKFRPGRNAKPGTVHSMTAWRSSANHADHFTFSLFIVLLEASRSFEHVSACTPPHRFYNNGGAIFCTWCKFTTFLHSRSRSQTKPIEPSGNRKNCPYPGHDRTKNVRGEFSRGSDLRYLMVGKN